MAPPPSWATCARIRSTQRSRRSSATRISRRSRPSCRRWPRRSDPPADPSRGECMKRARRAAICAAAALAIASVWASPRGAEAADPKLKELMGENFAGLQRILVALIQSKYADISDPVKLIHDHATQLTKMVPASAEAHRDLFLTYAYNLRGNADDLASIAQILSARDSGKEQVATDELREAAAAHYGGMVTMCVACHNRFRLSGPR